MPDPVEAASTKPVSPVTPIPGDAPVDAPDENGVALCLSGGGYRAMLYHVGALRRLNELGLLARLTRVSSVSGGSIAAGVLGVAWKDLAFDAAGRATRFDALVQEPLRRMGAQSIDVAAVLAGVFGPGTVAGKVAKRYAKHLFGDATLQDLPDAPRFVLNATNLQTGALWRFSKPYMGDYRVGLVHAPTLPIAQAVAASSAFPPVLSPMVLSLNPPDVVPEEGSDLNREPYTRRAVLADGGVYDNLGLETAWKRCRTVLVSDGGGKMKPQRDPSHLWPVLGIRVAGIVDDQVRSLRKRALIDSYRLGNADPRGERARRGCYWGIRTPVSEYGLADALPCPAAATTAIAEIETRLTHLDDDAQERLIDWGYASADAALRAFHVPGAPPPTAFPFARGVG